MTVNNENLCVYVLLLIAQSRLTLHNPINYIAHQAPLSMGFSRQEYGVGCHALLQGIFPCIYACTLEHTHTSYSPFLCVCVCLRGKNPRVHSSSCEMLLNISSGYFLLTFMVFLKNKVLPFIDFFFFFSKFIFGRATQQAESYFPDQGANPAPLQWKC